MRVNNAKELFVKMPSNVWQRTETATSLNRRLGHSIDYVWSERQRRKLSEFRDQKPSPPGDVSPIGSM